jgi:hypothetical protein
LNNLTVLEYAAMNPKHPHKFDISRLPLYVKSQVK